MRTRVLVCVYVFRVQLVELYMKILLCVDMAGLKQQMFSGNTEHTRCSIVSRSWIKWSGDVNRSTEGRMGMRRIEC